MTFQKTQKPCCYENVFSNIRVPLTQFFLEFLKPYKPRPQTTALLANRLVAGALGLHLPLSKNHEAEKKKLKEAKGSLFDYIKKV